MMMVRRRKKHRIEKKEMEGKDKYMNRGNGGRKENRSFVLQLYHVGLMSAALPVKCLWSSSLRSFERDDNVSSDGETANNAGYKCRFNVLLT